METTSYRPSCFVIAPVEAQLERFLEELREHRVEPFFISDFLKSGKKILPQLRSAFRSVDFVIAIIFHSPSIENTLFELGFALGQTRPVLIFAEPAVALPSAVTTLQVHYVELDRLEALIPAVGQFIERSSYQPQLKQYVASSIDSDLRAPLLDHKKRKDALRSLRQIEQSGHAGGTREIESALLETFDSLGWYTIEAPSRNSKGRAPDLAIWIDDVQRQLGNPIAIEIKSRSLPRH
jgi:hypothetical protein